ncbi:neurotrophin 1-like isoform X2 [Cydia pomonella]|uniref:neurotrophin 1-like isoform X2 n=1 Tax=Cydia pomonella TaxID=82600 RepID=UPI002ADE2A47|nr:neurotrophin 1-like isoform X2 [Cydia pomonella]
MAFKFISALVLVILVVADDDLQDFEFAHDDEIMIAQESRHYQTVVKPPVRIVKPHGVTNSHRPQYNIDSFEEEEHAETTTKRNIKHYKSSHKLRAKEGMIRDAVLRALERKDHVGKFAQILPIIRAMSGNQRVALASLVASQVSTPPGRQPLNLSQVRSMFGNANATSDLMLPILLDMANLIRKAVRSGKEPREVKEPLTLPQAQLLRRSFTEDSDSDTLLDDEPFEYSTTKAPETRYRRIPQRRYSPKTINKTDTDTKSNKSNEVKKTKEKSDNITRYTTTEAPSTVRNKNATENSTMDLMADATNQTLAQDLPVAEKLRALNRFIDRKGNLIRRGTFPPKPPARRATAESTISPVRRRPAPARKLPVITPSEQAKCELFTNTLCLHSEDYPTDAIIQSIRRNKAAAGALLADFRDPGEGALDGVTAAQEAKYTADHYLVSNRRGDTANRDFASAGEAGFMCPSTVKYARPQRARATSGQWKYIVNTGEHTQTLRLEKCLKPKESCTYLTDNFKSKCVQVYNYHRLLTWDQQNGLHMDIFKVPTCCSCHIEGYSVSFPPLGHRIHETSAENMPVEELSSEQGNHAFENVQPSVQRPTVSKNPPFTFNKPLESFAPFSDNHNLITDSFNQATSIRNVKRPPISRNPVSTFDPVTLPSYLEPPTPSAPTSFSFSNDISNKFKSTPQFKRGAGRPSRRPIRKKISGGPDDLSSSATSAVESFTGSNLETMEDFNEEIDEEATNTNQKSIPPRQVHPTIAPKLHAATSEKTPSFNQQEQNKSVKDNVSNGKRVNYNYHPIIDFFGEEEKEENDSIDREDVVAAYLPSSESEWKPMNHPPSRSSQNTNLVERKKHK